MHDGADNVPSETSEDWKLGRRRIVSDAKTGAGELLEFPWSNGIALSGVSGVSGLSSIIKTRGIDSIVSISYT